MLTVTFTLEGREKTFTDESLDKCCTTFFKDYGEAVDEVKKIHIFDTTDTNEKMTVEGKKSCAKMLKGLQLTILQPKEKK